MKASASARPPAKAICRIPALIGLRDHRRVGDPSGLWVSVRERAIRAGAGGSRPQVHRPAAEHIRVMGDKITAKETMAGLGVPCVPGSDGGVADAAGGAADRARDRLSGDRQGSRGRRRARHEACAHGRRTGHRLCAPPGPRPRRPSAMTRSISRKYLGRPRHIEVQVFGDGQGGAVHLGERDCSLQRRHQKVWKRRRARRSTPRHGRGSVRSAPMRWPGSAIPGAGTIEFLYEDGEFYFIEMNTRLQVEHPVTEEVFGVDLVREQIRSPVGRAVLQPGRTHPARSRDRGPDQRRAAAGNFTPSPGLIETSTTRRAGWACGWIRRSTKATGCRPIMTA
jgi:acetyl-CoA carboxylase biotin carboxylase subunit